MSETIRNDGQGSTESIVNKCIWCNRKFTRASTLVSHICESKRRHQNQNLKHVQIGFEAFNKFYKILQNSKHKSYIDFMKSPYYLAFVKLGRYVIEVGCFAIPSYIDWLLKNSIPLDKWNTDSIYTIWLTEWMYREDHWDGATRSFESMTDWANEHKSVFNHYFKYAASSKIIADIQTGRVSGWVIYGSNEGQTWLSALSDSELKYVWNLVDSDKWQKKIKLNKESYTDIHDLCMQAGL